MYSNGRLIGKHDLTFQTRILLLSTVGNIINIGVPLQRETASIRVSSGLFQIEMASSVQFYYLFIQYFILVIIIIAYKLLS